ncbi:glucose-6-phosphatase 3-like [Mercenaria mercenaria]|uniref:glucose-6-phosphatase 3-like n=1 Tax=Mercenaria mercenaria TaxID=6596 RepID=UPI00234F715D|nr:glucose-6-phosphatase 3-like [Mercenaria mercenaria]XP_053409123.1 glucose-6-phosphatase 3-like [Mercenaria mercenaria]
MDLVHNWGVDVVRFLQSEFKNYDELMMAASHLGDPRNAFLLYFPLAYCLHKPTGIRVLWLASLSEWINALLKWILHGERPYWWVLDPRTHHSEHAQLQQYRLTCETGPGSPSGHAMVTSSVVFCLVLSTIQNTRPRIFLQYVIWSVFAVFMFAVNVSRLFIATHFPHQVILGTLLGIILTLLVYKIDLQHLKLSRCVTASFLMPTSCIVTFYLLKWCGLDPQWSISLATKYCAYSEWIHLDTTLFNAVYRDAGSVLGYGTFMFGFTRLLRTENGISDKKGGKTDSDSLENASCRTVWLKMPNIILSLLVCQIGENMKPGLHSAEFYYFVTYLKFCILVILVMFTASFDFLKQDKCIQQKNK